MLHHASKGLWWWRSASQPQKDLWAFALTLARFLACIPIFIAPLLTPGVALRLPKEMGNVAVTGAMPHLVSTPLGYIQGKECPLDARVTEFYGIPFAEAPVGDLRFRPPVPSSKAYPLPALQAVTVPPPCGTVCGTITDFQSVDPSEDCLYLNIWTPVNASADSSKLPVRLYIHGGVDLSCSASDPKLTGCIYSGRTGHVVVNIQFRKGLFGSLAQPATMAESRTTGNWNILDQQLAMRWVQDNIAYFGGDPKKVLLNGNSAGAQSVDFHIISPLSTGLFAAALSESPPCVKLITLDDAYNVTDLVSLRLGCGSSAEDPVAQIGCLRSVSWKTLYDLEGTLAMEVGITLAMCEGLTWDPYFNSVKDGYVFPHGVLEALELGEFNRVPYMVGLNAQEGTAFVTREVTNTTFLDMLVGAFPTANLANVEALYPPDKFLATYDPAAARAADLWTDLFFACPILERLRARLQTGSAPTYLYKWEVTPTCPVESMYLGATHASELLFVNGIVEHIEPPIGTCDFTEKEKVISTLMEEAWSTMTVTGVPHWPNGAPWPEWTLESNNGARIELEQPNAGVVDLATKCDVIFAARDEALANMKSLRTSAEWHTRVDPH